MQNDGNFVVYERSGKAAWESGRYGSRYYGSRIVMQDDGNLVIYDRKWEPIWSSGTHQTSKPCELNAGHYLPVGGELFSQNQFYRLVYQGDGNLVIYNKSNRPLWASNTQGKPAWRTYMQNDGNFVVYKRRGAPVWASGRYGSQYYGSRIVMQNDGNLVIYDRYRRAIWASNTVQTPPSDSVYFSNKSVLNNNYFSAGQGLVSGNNLYRLIYQDDGNLLIYKGDLKTLIILSTIACLLCVIAMLFSFVLRTDSFLIRVPSTVIIPTFNNSAHIFSDSISVIPSISERAAFLISEKFVSKV
jgi:hypothetical protein